MKSAFKLIDTNPSKALEELEKADKASGPEVAYARGLAYQKQGKLDEAASALSEAVNGAPKQSRPRSALALVQILRGKINEAREHLHTVMVNDPADLRAILLYSICVVTDKQRTEALFALGDWPDKRPKPQGLQKQAPLTAEYFLTIASLEQDKVQEEAARQGAKRAEIGSIQAALALVQYANHLGRRPLAKSLLAKLAKAEVQPDQLEIIVKLSLSLGDVKTAGVALARLPGNLRSLDTLVLRGRYELGLRRPQRALSPLLAARKKVKNGDTRRLNEVDVFIAMALFAKGDDEDAIKGLEAVLKRTPNHKAGGTLFAQIELRQNRSKEAIARLEALLRDYPNDAALLDELGSAQMKGKRFADAEQTYKKLSALRPKDVRTHRKIANALHRQKKENAALAYLEDSVKLLPDDLKLRRALATQYNRLKKPEEAIRAVQDENGSQKNPVGFGLLLADVYDTLRRPEDVKKTLEELVEAAPKSDRAWSALAKVQGRERNWKGMETSLRKSIQLNPRAFKDKAQLAALLQKLGKGAEAAALYAELAADSGEDVIALNNAAMLYAGELNDPKRAVEFAEKAFTLAPKSVAVRDTLGWSLARRGRKVDLEKAVKLLQKTSAQLKTGESYYHYAYAQIKMGNQQAGIALLKSALGEPGDEKWRSEAKELLGQEE